MSIIARQISSRFFDFSAKSMCLSAEISTLEANIGNGVSQIIFSQVYDDACDAGFTMVSHKTNQAITFYYSHEDRDANGEEVYGWNFVITPESARKNPKLKDLKVLVVND